MTSSKSSMIGIDFGSTGQTTDQSYTVTLSVKRGCQSDRAPLNRGGEVVLSEAISGRPTSLTIESGR